MAGRRWVGAVRVGCVVFGVIGGMGSVAGCGSSGPAASGLPTGRPVLATPPTSTVNEACSPPVTRLPATPRRPGLDPNPIGVTAVWFRGPLAGGNCTEPDTAAPMRLARRLALDIRRAPPYAPGKYACPADFEHSVALYFRYAHRAKAELIRLSLTGCARIATSDHTMGLQPAAVIADLVPITPPDFRAG